MEDAEMDHQPEELTEAVGAFIRDASSRASDILCHLQHLGKSLYEHCTPEQQSHYNSHVSSILGNKPKQRITGSKSYELFTYLKNKTPDWDKKFHAVFISEFRGTDDMNNALRYEPKARAKYSELTGNQIGKLHRPFVHPLVPWFSISPNGLIFTSGNCVALWKNKIPSRGKQENALEIMEKDECMNKNRDLKKKHKVYGSIQLGMLLLSLPKCIVTFYSMKYDDVEIKEVTFDAEFCNEYASKLTEIYFKKILPKLTDREQEQEQG